MTVVNQNSKVSYNGTGAQTTFAISFPFVKNGSNDSTLIEVYLRDESVAIPTEALQAGSGVDYSVVGTDVVFIAAPAATDIVLIRRVFPKLQDLDLINGGAFLGQDVEEALDDATYTLQQVCEKIDRAALLPNTSPLGSGDQPLLPEFVGNANKFLAINATEDGIEATSVDLAATNAAIAANTALINTNIADIATNVGDIATNTADIATNLANITTNDGDIAALQAQQGTNTANIATNTADIATNTADIALLQAGTDVLSFSGCQGVQNGAGAVDLVELAFDGDDYSSAIIEYEITRSTDAPDVRFTTGILYAQFKGGAWRVERGLDVGDADGLTFSIATDGANVGRIDYTSDLMPGTPNSYMSLIQYKVRQFPIPMTNSVVINNAQAVALAIGGLAFDGDTYSSVIIDYEIDRSTDAPDVRFTSGIIYLQFKGGAWRLERGLNVGDFDGVNFAITTDGANVGTVEYTTDTMPGGTYVGEFKWDFRRFLQPTSVD